MHPGINYARDSNSPRQWAFAFVAGALYGLFMGVTKAHSPIWQGLIGLGFFLIMVIVILAMLKFRHGLPNRGKNLRFAVPFVFGQILFALTSHHMFAWLIVGIFLDSLVLGVAGIKDGRAEMHKAARKGPTSSLLAVAVGQPGGQVAPGGALPNGYIPQPVPDQSGQASWMAGAPGTPGYVPDTSTTMFDAVPGGPVQSGTQPWIGYPTGGGQAGGYGPTGQYPAAPQPPPRPQPPETGPYDHIGPGGSLPSAPAGMGGPGELLPGPPSAFL